MDITKFDPATDTEAALTLAGEDMELQQRLENSLQQDCDCAWVVRWEGEPAGLCSLRRFSGRRADLAVYVQETFWRRGIGTALLQLADRYVADSAYEHIWCEFEADDRAAAFLERNGYRLFCAAEEMERSAEPLGADTLSESALRDRGIVIRPYEDGDYLGWHTVSDVGFYLLRQRFGLTPPFYWPPQEWERRKFAQNPEGRFVMDINGAVSAICELRGCEVHQLAVRPDLQGQGYGRLMLREMLKWLSMAGTGTATLSVLRGNPAQKLYESVGFRRVKTVYNYVKYHKADSRLPAPPGYAGEEEILRDLRLYGRLREEMLP